jgi:hypothetical protein
MEQDMMGIANSFNITPRLGLHAEKVFDSVL